jgi:hypothetical protein
LTPRGTPGRDSCPSHQLATQCLGLRPRFHSHRFRPRFSGAVLQPRATIVANPGPAPRRRNGRAAFPVPASPARSGLGPGRAGRRAGAVVLRAGGRRRVVGSVGGRGVVVVRARAVVSVAGSCVGPVRALAVAACGVSALGSVAGGGSVRVGGAVRGVCAAVASVRAAPFLLGHTLDDSRQIRGELPPPTTPRREPTAHRRLRRRSPATRAGVERGQPPPSC